MSTLAPVSTDRFSLAGRKCLVTGGTKGIGKAIVEEFCKLQAEVFTCSRNAEELDKAIADWTAKGYKVYVGCTAGAGAAVPGLSCAGVVVQGAAVDLSKAQDRQELAKKVTSAFGGELHVLVNNAGTNIKKPTVEYTQQEYQFVMSTNLDSAYNLCQLCQPMLKASGTGSIVMVSSVAGGPTANRAGSVYAMSKAAMNQLAKNLSCEWAKDGIRVNSVSPWVTVTELALVNLKDKEYEAGVLSRTPMGRLGQPEDISGVVAFLCSPAAAWLTGQNICVDGGYSIAGFF